jgi:endonuclease/exonuclease/phosphatase family metal-dependent hydrolase
MTVCELKFDFHRLSVMFLKIVSAFPFRRVSGLLIVTMISSLQTGQAQKGDLQTNSLLECGAAQQIVQTGPHDELKFVSYNIRWRSGKELDQIISWLKERRGSAPMIIALQEVDRAKSRSGEVNNPKQIANALGMNYAWAAPASAASDKSKRAEEETGVEVVSPYRLTDVTRIILPNPGPAGRQRVAVAATLTVGETSIRVYSVHSETRLPIAKKVEQLQAVLTDLDRFPKGTPAAVLGDFNTWELPAVEGIRKLFTEAGFTTPLPDDESTFYRKALMFDVKLKLDWIWLRGFVPQSYGIDRNLTVSDHFPLWTVATFSPPARTSH